MLEFLDSGERDVVVSHSSLSTGTAVSVALPEGDLYGGVVLIPDVFGLRDLVDDTISVIASHGYAVIAVELFSRLNANPSSLSREEKLNRVNELNDHDICTDILGAGQLLKRQHGCHEIGLIGFCIGGMYAFKCAGFGVFDRVVSCYGMIRIPDDWKGEDSTEPLEYLSNDFCSPVLAIIGEDDESFAQTPDVALLREVLSNEHHQAIGSRLEIFSGARHAFMHDPLREEYRSDDARRAWALAADFLSVDL